MRHLDDESASALLARLAAANRVFADSHPGDSVVRQPVHTVYGGAHLFQAGLVAKLGAMAVRALDEYAADAGEFARALDLDGDSGFAATLHARVLEKLRREPVEDFRIDFEDGYGYRSDAEEDGHALAVAAEIAAGMERGTLPPFLGLRIKPLTEELRVRAVRTLDLCVGELARRTGGRLPEGFAITLPKVTTAGQVEALAGLLALLEERSGLASGALRIELMIETPQAILDADGVTLPRLLAAGGGRCRSAHFGTYDYTALCNITAAHQAHIHPACDFARHVMQVLLAQTGVTMSDGATTVLPIAPHRAAAGGPPLTPIQVGENRRVVHAAWRLHHGNIRHSLRHGIYQGWDLNPAQLPARYAAVFGFFLEARDEAAARLRGFIDKAAQATLSGNVFDDAATGQGLLNFFLRGINCGALTEDEALAAGVTLEELRGRSFPRIVDARR